MARRRSSHSCAQAYRLQHTGCKTRVGVDERKKLHAENWRICSAKYVVLYMWCYICGEYMVVGTTIYNPTEQQAI